MIVIADISQKIFTLNSADNQDKNLYFGFTDSDGLPVMFDNLTFGVSVSEGSTLVQEATFPQNGLVYESTDQEFLVDLQLSSVKLGRQYSLKAWVSNAGETWEQSFDLLLPKWPQLYPSWSWSDELEFWQPPVPYPNDGSNYKWDELSVSWVVQE